MFKSWWEAHKWGAVPQDVLSPCAVIIEHEGKPLAAAWLYLANGVGISWMEWTVTNPSNTAKQSIIAITMLVDAIKTVAKTLNYGVVMTTCRQASLGRLLEKSGFTKTDESVSHYLMPTGL